MPKNQVHLTWKTSFCFKFSLLIVVSSMSFCSFAWKSLFAYLALYNFVDNFYIDNLMIDEEEMGHFIQLNIFRPFSSFFEHTVKEKSWVQVDVTKGQSHLYDIIQKSRWVQHLASDFLRASVYNVEIFSQLGRSLTHFCLVCIILSSPCLETTPVVYRQSHTTQMIIIGVTKRNRIVGCELWHTLAL